MKKVASKQSKFDALTVSEKAELLQKKTAQMITRIDKLIAKAEKQQRADHDDIAPLIESVRFHRNNLVKTLNPTNCEGESAVDE